MQQADILKRNSIPVEPRLGLMRVFGKMSQTLTVSEYKNLSDVMKCPEMFVSMC